MAWLIAAVVVLVAVGVGAWFYPQLKSRVLESGRVRAFRAVAESLHTELADGRAFVGVGFMPTVQSIFGPHGEVRHAVVQELDGETVYLFEYLFGSRPSAGYRRGVAVVAVHLAKPVPMFTLNRPRGAARSRTTEFGARGQRLVVQAIGDLELWSLKGERKRVRSLVTPVLERLDSGAGWDIRGIDDWLVLFNEAAQGDLGGFYHKAIELRSALAVR